MKFYIASGLKNYKQVQELTWLLQNAGWELTYDWTLLSNVIMTNTEMLRSIGKKELEGIRKADVIIILAPNGRGTHTEFGMAIALNKKVYLCNVDDTYFKCNKNTVAFYWLPQVTQIVGNTEYIARELLRSEQR